MTTRVTRFVEGVLTQEGALVDGAEEGRLEAVLPPGLQRQLELGELAVLVENDKEQGDMAYGYGAEGLDRIVRVALGQQGRVLAGQVTHPVPSPRPPKAYTGLNLSVRVGAITAAPAWSLIGLGRYVATSDDQREGLVRVALPALSGGPVEIPGLEAFAVEPVDVEELPATVLRAGFHRLRTALVDASVTRLAGFREAVSRRHRRDAERVDQYFADVRADLARRIGIRKDTPGLRAKLAALPAEQLRRRSQLVANHALQVTLDLVGLVAIRGPGLDAELIVKRRKHERTLPVRFDGLANQWAPLQCDGCGQNVFAFAMCDDAAHVLCAECWDRGGSGGHRDCFRCSGKPLVPAWKRRLVPLRLNGASPQGTSPKTPAPKTAVAPRPAVRPAPSSSRFSPRPETRQTQPNRTRNEVIQVLKQAVRPCSSHYIRRFVDLSAAQLRSVLTKMIDEGLVKKTGRGTGTSYEWVG
jgi:hypothetical protein